MNSASDLNSNRHVGRYGVLLGAIIVQLILGTVYGYSIFWQPLSAEVYPEVVPVQRIITRDEAAGRVVTQDRAVELAEAGSSIDGLIVVRNDQDAAERRRQIQEGQPVDGFLIVEDADTAVAVKAGESVPGYTIVADEEAMKTQLDEQKGNLKYAFAICILSFALTMVIAGRFQDIKGPRFPAIVGAVLMGGGDSCWLRPRPARSSSTSLTPRSPAA